MRFAGDSLIQSGVDTALPGSKRHYQDAINKPDSPTLDAGDLEATPEMRPGPYFPGQDLMRDKYIRENPGSGVAQGFQDGQEVALGGVGVAAGVIGGLKLLQSARLGLSGGAVNPGTLHDYKNQDPTNQYNRHKQDADKNYMEIMKSGFI
jgi:hypothetical protein